MTRARKEPEMKASKGRAKGAGVPALVTGAAETRDRLTAMSAIGNRFNDMGWRPASEVLLPVRAVPTIFPGYDAITRVAGHPTDRIGLVHGPSGHGKTAFCLGLLLSFLKRDHFAAIIDAEQTTPITWVRQLMGDYHKHPGFRALRPKTNEYEEVVGMVEKFATTVGEAREKGDVDKDTTGMIAVDSLKKLIPKKLLEEMLRAAGEDAGKKGGRFGKKDGGVDGMAGRAGQHKAALNAAWMDRLVPLMAHTGCAIVLIAREYEDSDAGFFSTDDFKVGGGKSPYYDSSIVVRAVHKSWVRDGVGPDAPTYGEEIEVEVRKTKVGGKDDRIPSSRFFMSNGILAPVGFDTARDLLEFGIEHDIVTVSGSHYSFGRKKLGQGKHGSVRRLYDDSALLRELEERVREEIAAIVRKEEEAESTAASTGALPEAT